MKVMKDDGLPQQICAYCDGKLNFIDTFYMNCQNIQKLHADEQRTKKKNDVANDTEINKENTAPKGNRKKKKASSNTDYVLNSITNFNTMCQLPNESRKKDRIENCLHEADSKVLQKDLPIQNLEEVNIKEEIIEEECLNGKTPLCNIIKKIPLDNTMVWIHLPAIHELDKLKQDDVANKISLLAEEADERINLEPGIPNNVMSSVIVSDLSKIIPSKLDLNLSGTVKQENAITGPSLISSSNKENHKLRIAELMTKEQKEIIEQCYKIDMSIVDKEKVNTNMIVRKKYIECNICFLRYSRRDKCEVHVWRHLNMKPYQCTACNFTTVTLSNIRCHIRKSHLKLKPYSCTQCTKQYTSSVLLQEHMHIHTGARPYKCEECNFASNSRQVLSNHKDIHKLNENLPCPVCNKSFASRLRLRMHKRIHNDNRIICEVCRIYLSSEKALKEHQNKMHLQNYNCNVCSKVFKSKKALHSHMNTHAEAKHKCNICSNVYKSRHILSEHILKHKGIRKYNCSICNKNFAQLSHLAAHKKVHSPPSYECEGCNKKFNRRDNMKTHMKCCSACKALPNNI